MLKILFRIAVVILALILVGYIGINSYMAYKDPLTYCVNLCNNDLCAQNCLIHAVQ